MDLPKIEGEYRFNYPLKNLTWFKVGGAAEIFFKPANVKDLKYFLENIDSRIDIHILGACSNIIIRDGGIKGVVIKLGQNFSKIQLEENKLIVGAGCLNYNLAKFCANNVIAGFEFLVGIPGGVGGGIAMNAGAYGREFKDIIIEIKAIDYKGQLFTIPLEEIKFQYRRNNLPKNLIYISASFKIQKDEIQNIKLLMQDINTKRNASQPIKERTGGSSFANPDPTVTTKKSWELIDEAGMRGYKIGGASISNLHCNFMINDGTATAADLENLGEMVRKKVYEKSGVELRWEIKRIGY